jgi:hypothetical protein
LCDYIKSALTTGYDVGCRWASEYGYCGPVPSLELEFRIQPTLPAARPLALAGYPIALLLIVTSLLDTFPKILPADMGSRDWRYGALGLVFNSMVTPLLGLAIAAASAIVARHVGTLRLISGLFLALAVFAVLGGLLFIIDFNALSAGLSERVTPGFEVATWKTVAIVLLAIPVAAWLGIGGLRAARAEAGSAGSRSNDAGLVVGH